VLENLSSGPGRRVVVALAVLAGVGLLGGYAVAMRAKPKAETISLDSPTPAGRGSRAIFVHVGGEVRRPGLYEVREGSRVNDAVEAAGGTTDDADLDGLNLAAKVKDGDKVLVPAKTEPGAVPQGGPASASGAQASGVVNLNAATLADLETLPGIGPALAERIIAFRTEHGGFQRVEDLLEVPGIGPKKYESLKDHVTV
jgi:competence protein ComEA